ncbi:cytoplasmic dynein 2 light intermediate chain 1-like [Mytilus californianus]|uniref:cytoplasmic dynein 2 light intermediate chain 1-like n=1 Tax=Mytilus californianus TaxID=6549 RepID=UPI002248158A|nr:cytoplasmic dynein 2 light intermediate chain 1-like [Mytilus californianus]
MSKGLEKSLWDVAIQESNESKAEGATGEESSVFIVGAKNSGKTSIVLRFLDRDEAPKPTVALEYTFGRRAKGHNIAKDVGHIWELGGGTWLSKLMDVPLNPSSLSHTAVAIVIDLSKPKEIWYNLETLLNSAKSRLNTVIEELKSEDPGVKDRLTKQAWERVGADHPDKNLMNPFLVPLIIIGGKYDLFQEFGSEERKVICKTLRFLAHTHGATLQFFSIKQETLVTKMKGLLSHNLFGTTANKTLQTDHNKPIMVPAGLDSLQQIGSPPLSEKDIGRISAKNPIELWKHAFAGFFPPESTSNPAIVDDPSKDPQYSEPNIDSLRSQKDEELERYRRLCERKARETQRSYGKAYA